jgi:Fur family ferric uptake transcriptional regulator/Fur family peroxide stress response transcriptional regulator
MIALPELLRERGLRVTSQRVVIHDALVAAGRHLTAEQVRDAVRDLLPGVSLPTVYSTLELLEELGLIRRVHTPSALLFDPRPDEHAHALCRRCGRVEDLDAHVHPRAALRVAAAAGWTTASAETLLVGLCPECAGRGRDGAAEG